MRRAAVRVARGLRCTPVTLATTIVSSHTLFPSHRHGAHPARIVTGVPEELPEERRQRQRPQKRWGLRTLGFLAIALASVLTSSLSGGNYALLTSLGIIVGFVGAGYCSYRGLKQGTWLPR